MKGASVTKQQRSEITPAAYLRVVLDALEETENSSQQVRVSIVQQIE